MLINKKMLVYKYNDSRNIKNNARICMQLYEIK